MIQRCPLARPSSAIVALVVVLLASTAFTVLHWHNNVADHGCQLCHVRHLPSLHSAIVITYRAPVVSQRDWTSEYSGEELQPSFRNTSSRSPPAPIFINV